MRLPDHTRPPAAMSLCDPVQLRILMASLDPAPRDGHVEIRLRGGMLEEAKAAVEDQRSRNESRP